MKGIHYMAALGTICIFLSVYAFQAAFYKKKFKEYSIPKPIKKRVKIGLLILSMFFLVVGIFLLGTAFGIL